MREPFRLTEAEKANPLWLRLRAYLQERLASRREANDNPDLPEHATQAIRGEIATLKDILRAEKSPATSFAAGD